MARATDGALPARDPFEALGDANRRAILELLRPGGQSVQELADALPISRPAVSRHLRLLKEAGLVVEEPLGTRRIYRLHDEGVEAVRRYLQQVWGDAATRFRLVAENTEANSPDLARPATPDAAAVPDATEVSEALDAGAPDPTISRGPGRYQSYGHVTPRPGHFLCRSVEVTAPPGRMFQRGGGIDGTALRSG